MSDEPFSGRRPIFIGDDITDEDAFEVVNEMGGYSVRVGPWDGKSAARFELRDVDAVRDWLNPLAQT
jgi:trehalose 6-phosphate phosphatase